jgi:hypothetical protein
MLFVLALLAVAPSSSALDVAGSGFYRVVLDTTRAGAYTASTGPDHPVTASEARFAALLGGGHVDAAISYPSIRSHVSGSDYHFFLTRFLLVDDPARACIPSGSVDTPMVTSLERDGLAVGIEATWNVHEGADQWSVRERLVARGIDLTSSAVEVTLAITNEGSSNAVLGVRQLWALQLGNMGGAASPAIGPIPPSPPTEPFEVFESEYLDPAFRSFLISNEESPSVPGPVDDNVYAIEALVGGVPLDPPPTPPDRLVYAPWGEILAPPDPRRFGPLNACFDFELHDPPRQTFNAAGSSVAFYWGERPESARVVAPGETVTFTQYLVAYLDFPLACDAGAPSVVECAGRETIASLDGGGSENLAGEPIEFLWSTTSPMLEIGDVASPSPEVVATALGVHPVELLVHRGAFARSCTTAVHVVDTTPPVVNVARAVPSRLWPPNHRLVPVTVELGAADACDDAPTVTLVDVLSNEDEDARGTGDGHARPDVVGAELGTDDRSVMLRAERNGTGHGRVYTLLYEVRDGSGNVTPVAIEVGVAHDQGWGGSSPRAPASRTTRPRVP